MIPYRRGEARWTEIFAQVEPSNCGEGYSSIIALQGAEPHFRGLQRLAMNTPTFHYWSLPLLSNISPDALKHSTFVWLYYRRIACLGLRNPGYIVYNRVMPQTNGAIEIGGTEGNVFVTRGADGKQYE